MSFYKLGIKGDLVYSLESFNIAKPTPIQSLSIPYVLAGNDLIAEAQTGTGKTFAFLLPMFQNSNIDNPNIQGLIITPTRELAIQITGIARKLSEVKQLNILAAYGGQDVNAQLLKLDGDIQIVIGTPGRILDHLRRGSINFSDLKTLVVDEADQMFHIGFKNDVESIIEQLPKNRQTLCFSATISHSVDSFSSKYLTNPKLVIAPKKQITLDNITQIVVESSNRKKFTDFLKILDEEKPKKAIVFCRSRMGTNDLYEEMLEAGLNAEAIHGGLTQAKREYVINLFKSDKVKYLVATDVAARGLDIDGISHIFNYNLPDDPENYIHRIGRTGRAGNTGIAYTIVTQKDFNRLEAIEKFINMTISRIKVQEPKAVIAKKNTSNNNNIPKQKEYSKTTAKSGAQKKYKSKKTSSKLKKSKSPRRR